MCPRRAKGAIDGIVRRAGTARRWYRRPPARAGHPYAARLPNGARATERPRRALTASTRTR